ncbi:Guanylate cyclase [Aphelenchoides bicaudatus]|nr:Guanylate cyclase [Aphelenchoides bicaudatus]
MYSLPPPCIDDNAVLASHVGSYFNTPVMLWGSAFDSEFTEKSLYPTVLSALPNYADLANVICSAMNFLDWTLYALIYQASEDGGCFAFSEDMEVRF